MMTRLIQLAHGGRLPDDVLVCFANTGREAPATLDFVQECSARWGLTVHWLEFRSRSADGFEEVNHNSASRDGRPFELLISDKQMLPNPVMRFCTEELKIRTIRRFVRARFGWDGWLSVVGLRADEPGRVAKLTSGEGRSRRETERFPAVCPLHTAGVTRDDVLAFWREQPFGLRLAGDHWGNCDGCFLKSRGAISRCIQEDAERMAWWPRMEATKRGVTVIPREGLFRSDRESYAVMADTVARQGVLPFNVFDDRTDCQWACTD